MSLCTFLIMPLTCTSWVQGYRHNFFTALLRYDLHDINPPTVSVEVSDS